MILQEYARTLYANTRPQQLTPDLVLRSTEVKKDQDLGNSSHPPEDLQRNVLCFLP